MYNIGTRTCLQDIQTIHSTTSAFTERHAEIEHSGTIRILIILWQKTQRISLTKLSFEPS